MQFDTTSGDSKDLRVVLQNLAVTHYVIANLSIVNDSFDLTGHGAAPTNFPYSCGGNKGLSVTITTAKLTVGGANGSMTFTGGLLTPQTPAAHPSPPPPRRHAGDLFPRPPRHPRASPPP